MVYDRKHDVFVLFGGKCLDSSCTAGESLDDTWVYDLSTSTWTAMSPPLSPPPRDQHMMAYDRVNEVTVLFGGRNEAGTLYNDLWVYDHASNRWTEVFPAQSPSARRLSSLVYDDDRNLFVLYGGGSSKGGLRDLWVLTLQDDGTIPPNSPPMSIATVTPNQGDTRIEFLFDGTQSFDTDGTLATYHWDFGDGSTSSGALVPHTYASAGTYTVSLTVTDDDLATHSTTIDVVVDEPLIPATITIQSVVIRGSIDDPTVSEVIVDGVAVPVIGGAFEILKPVTTNPTLVIIEATNGVGATSTKRVTITEQ
ncbi:PKD domain-containing protein [Candidatus Uhrbacteria bacterium]|nr:PKD domain-containing protein [Candidatus Uhrbacteria bacterium]